MRSSLPHLDAAIAALEQANPRLRLVYRKLLEDMQAAKTGDDRAADLRGDVAALREVGEDFIAAGAALRRWADALEPLFEELTGGTPS